MFPRSLGKFIFGNRRRKSCTRQQSSKEKKRIFFEKKKGFTVQLGLRHLHISASAGCVSCCALPGSCESLKMSERRRNAFKTLLQLMSQLLWVCKTLCVISILYCCCILPLNIANNYLIAYVIINVAISINSGFTLLFKII